jgi:hypothetical protein
MFQANERYSLGRSYLSIFVFVVRRRSVIYPEFDGSDVSCQGVRVSVHWSWISHLLFVMIVLFTSL